MKTFKRSFIFAIVLLLTIVVGSKTVLSQGQLTAPTGTQFIPSDYVDPTIPDDLVFIFCSPDANGDTVAGTLSVMGGYASCVYDWQMYDPDPLSPTFQTFVQFVSPMPTGPSSTVTGLESGFYQVVITCNGGLPSETTSCRRAHVFVNETILDFDEIPAGCNPFDLTNGMIDAVSDFVVYDPAPTPFIVDSTTEITVCFWADHTFVSDLGFYLYGPSGGRVDLLPPVSAWNNGSQVTDLIAANVLSCASNVIGTSCNNGNDIVEFCFTTALPSGNPSFTACICDMSTPLTGTFASAEDWSDVYGDSASNGGWAVSVFDCFGADIGSLQRVTLTFDGEGQCGNATYAYDSGDINESINDGACDSTTAAIYYIPMKSTSQHTITNEVTAQWDCNLGWDAAWGSQDFAINPVPSIDPEPTVSAYFSLTVYDHLYDTLGFEISGYIPCEPIVERYFETLPTSSTILNPPQQICQNAPPQQLIPLNAGGIWGGFGITGGGFFFPANAYLGPNTITYGFGGVCATDTAIIIDVVGSPEVTFITETCNSTNTSFQVCFEISGGNPGAYSFIDATTGLPFAGNISGATWCSDWITSPSDYSIIVNDNFDCDPKTVNGYHNCGCTSQAGVMDNTLIEACAFESAESIVQEDINGDITYTLDGNDGFEYYLHTNPYGYLGTVLDHNTTGLFFFNVNMVYGETYYISQVVGDNIGTPTVNVVDILNDDCISVAQGTPVIWYEFPTADAGSDNVICGNAIDLFAVNPTVGVGVWTCQTAPGVIWGPSFDNPETNVIVPYFDTNQYGCFLNTEYTFRWTVTNGVPSCTYYDDVDMMFKPQPVAFAGNDTTVCGLQINLNADFSLCGPLGITEGLWSGNGSFNNVQDPNTTLNVYNPGTVTYIWREWNGDCEDIDYVTITFLENPVVDANHTDSVCGTEYILDAISTMGTGVWTGPLGTIFGDDTNPTTTAEIIFGPNESQVDALFTWHETNGICESQDDVTIVYSTTPNAAAGLDDWNCGTSYTFDADILGFEYAIGTWTTDFTGAAFDNINSPNATMTIPNTGSFVGEPQAGSFGDSSHVAIPITWIMDNNKCWDKDTILITLYQIPVADAGPDSSVCGKVYEMHADFSIGAPKGQWSMVQGPSALPPSFIDDTDPHTIVQVPMHGEYTFQWLEKNEHNQTCATTDEVVIFFIEIPDVNAGPDKYVCGEDTYLEAINSTGTGVWLPTQAYIDDIGDPLSLTHYGQTGTNDVVEYVWQEVNEYAGIQCVSQDSVNIVFMIVPEATIFPPVGNIAFVCGKTETSSENIFVAQSPGITGTNVQAYWTSNDTEFYPGPDALDPDSVTAYSYGVHEFSWVVENHHIDSVCADTSISILVDFIEQPVANSGPLYDTACGPWYGLQAEFSTTTGDSLAGTWITTSPDHVSYWYMLPGIDTIPSDSLPDNYVFVDFIDPITPVSYPLVWQETNYGELGFSCNDLATTIIMFAPKPTGIVESIFDPHCIGYEAKLKAANDYSITAWDWSDVDGGIITHVDGGGTVLDPLEGPVYVQWESAEALDEHFVRLITKNTWECFSPAEVDTIFEPDHVPVEDDIKPAYCGDPNGEISLLPDNAALINSYGWIDSLNVTWLNEVADFQGELATGDYHYWARAKSLVLPNPENIYCTDTFTIHVGDTGYVASLFNLQDITDTIGISPQSVEFTALSYMVDSTYTSVTNVFFVDLIDELPPAEELDADYQWRFYHIKFDSIPDFEAPVVIYPWETPAVINGEDIIEEANPVVEFIDPGHYKVELVTTSEFGCRDTFRTAYIFTDAKSKLVPGVNVFTPNGDGQNDFLEFETETLKSMRGVIFSRWGKKIYEWTWNESDQEPNPGWWDGKLSNGQDAAPGVYFYMIEGIGLDDNEFSGEEYSKAFHLIREKK